MDAVIFSETSVIFYINADILHSRGHENVDHRQIHPVQVGRTDIVNIFSGQAVTLKMPRLPDRNKNRLAARRLVRQDKDF